MLGSWGFNCTGDIDCLSLGVQKGYSEVGASKNDDSRAQEIWDEGLRAERAGEKSEAKVHGERGQEHFLGQRQREKRNTLM